MPKKVTKKKLGSKLPEIKLEKIISYRATSPDGKVQANGSTEKEALELLLKATTHV